MFKGASDESSECSPLTTQSYNFRCVDINELNRSSLEASSSVCEEYFENMNVYKMNP